MTDSFEIDVNRTRHHIRCAAETPLLYVLRNDLGLQGARFGCGLGLCGACFVLVDGHPTSSCDLPLWSATGHEITTVEGLGSVQRPHPLQRAFIEEQAAQCGYCTTGMIVTAAALLDQNPDPSEDEMRTALDRNLCRCGSHQRILAAVRRAASEGAR